MKKYYDKIIFGAGIYGMYAAKKALEKGQSVLLLEKDSIPFKRASYANQARVHLGFHYPRSISTAKKTAEYFNRFCKDFDICINRDFRQIYATSSEYSWTNAEQFKKFAEYVGIDCIELGTDDYFKKGTCDGAFLTNEFTYDAEVLKKYLFCSLKKHEKFTSIFGIELLEIEKREKDFKVKIKDSKNKGIEFITEFIINATYASVNQVLAKTKNFIYDNFDIKYELCEIILCKASERLKDIGLTVMDGPFFSIMPFGKSGYHSLTAVTFTPHITCYDKLPTFDCQSNSKCCPEQLENCINCKHQPSSSWPYMSRLAKKYMKDEFEFEYVKSLFSIKPILKSSEIDDSRPTVIKVASQNPTFISVLSGKVSTIYDLDDYI